MSSTCHSTAGAPQDDQDDTDHEQDDSQDVEQLDTQEVTQDKQDQTEDEHHTSRWPTMDPVSGS